MRPGAVLLLLALMLLAGCGGTSKTAATTSTVRRPVPARPKRDPLPRVLAETATGTLPAPLQDPSVAVAGGRVLLFGGLTAADVSTDQIVAAGFRSSRVAGRLPSARHDTAAAALGNGAYVFGGGDATSQLADVVRVAPGSGVSSVVSRLPVGGSDSSAAAIDGTAYVVGGYTGGRWLDTIVAYRPGRAPHVVARLPRTLRYAAVTAAGNELVIAGGSLENGTASSQVLAWRPGMPRAVVLGRMPAATTHAAAATLDGIAYVIGGRGAALDTPTNAIVAVDVAHRRVRPAGTLADPRSDLAAAALGSHLRVAGGRDAAGTVATVSQLAPSNARSLASSHSIDLANVYAHDVRGALAPAARDARQLVYVPNSRSDTVDVIDQHTFRIVEHFAVGGLPQHVVPAWDLKTLYVTNDTGNSLTPIDPVTGKPHAQIPVTDPYNMYFTPDGRYAIVVAERLRKLDFRDPHTFALHHSLDVPCAGVDHMDFSADERYLLASCEFSGQMVKVDVKTERVLGTLTLPDGPSGMPQDVKLSPDGKVFYVADMMAGGVWLIDGRRLKTIGFIRTGAGAHGLYPSRDSKLLYITNRGEGSISVLDFRTRKLVAKWQIPGGGSPDMGGVSADGKVLWLSGRYNGVVYAISTSNGRLLARIPVGLGPHGLCVWPQPGRYSLGHTGILR